MKPKTSRFGVSKGFGILEIVIALAVVSAISTAVFTVIRTYNNAIERANVAERRADEMESELLTANSQIATLRGEKDAMQIRHQAELERVQAAHERQIDNERRAAAAVEKATVERIESTMNRDAERYTEFIRKVLPQNLKGLSCRSDLRTVDDPDACYITIR